MSAGMSAGIGAGVIGEVARVVLLTDRRQLPPGRELAATVLRCVESGLRWVVVREHDLPAAQRHELVAELAEVAGLTVISSRIPDDAAHGIHLAARQPAPPAAAPGRWGRSCHARSEVTAAAEAGASWVTLSPYATSASKPGYGPALDAQEYAGHAVPVLALGGVRPANAAAARAAGAHGVAVMGEVMRAHDPGCVLRDLRRAVERRAEEGAR